MINKRKPGRKVSQRRYTGLYQSRYTKYHPTQGSPVHGGGTWERKVGRKLGRY